MSAEPKRVELTEAERTELENSLRWHFAAHAESPEGGYASLGVDNALLRVARIVAAREAAAEQRGREDNALHDMCYVSGSKALEAREAAARREALLEAAEHFEQYDEVTIGETDIGSNLIPVPPEERLRQFADAALAEPERDEEGGR